MFTMPIDCKELNTDSLAGAVNVALKTGSMLTNSFPKSCGAKPMLRITVINNIPGKIIEKGTSRVS